MQLNTLQPRHPGKNSRPRVGRGGKRGTTAGKGTKGQKARSGHRIRPAMREYIQRLPKMRGQNNGPRSEPAAVISLSRLATFTSPVTAAVIVAAGFAHKDQQIKILASGEITKAVTVEGLKLSRQAKEKIEKAGGSVK